MATMPQKVPMTSPKLANSPDPFHLTMSRHQALAILSLLSGEARGVCNDRVLLDWLRDWGLGAERAKLHALLEDLERDGALILTRHADVIVIRLTERGDDLAKGYAQSERVLRPLPGGPYESLRAEPT